MPSPLQIHPGHGVGPFVLGMTRAELVEIAGEPDYVEHGELAEDRYENWCFGGGALEVRFEQGDGDRAGWIAVRDPGARLAGAQLIGLEERAALATMWDLGIGPIVLADDFGSGMRDYEWPATNLSFWVSEGVVESVTVMPYFDASGNVPLWPRDARPDGAPR